MRFIVVVFAVLMTAAASAQEASVDNSKKSAKPANVRVLPLNHFQIYPLAYEVRYEKDASENYVEQTPMNFSVAYRKASWSLLFEYSKFSQDSGNPTLKITRDHQETLLWGRWHLWRLRKKAMQVTVYGGGGLGTYKEDVTTTLSGSSVTESTGSKYMGGLAAGSDISYGFSESLGVIAAAEGRGLVGQEFDPNPTFGVLIRTGIYFAW
ncbi:hypothetical protein B9G69_001265 [Bdellovibrio sp. SKB1291214]|uniref:hypothetical protein n=1 Tax=Bdellovibrio sp. SKB1291214 TaxID=1732569 RepID=UPI000B5152EB|nr:hypothetical protein [Bdellovibrio sp. SKB1291214]UYL09205.1 hypothetical protein B9G69_001265 [Bdellovibrio sp. SKB1291214]